MKSPTAPETHCLGQSHFCPDVCLPASMIKYPAANLGLTEVTLFLGDAPDEPSQLIKILVNHMIRQATLSGKIPDRSGF